MLDWKLNNVIENCRIFCLFYHSQVSVRATRWAQQLWVSSPHVTKSKSRKGDSSSLHWPLSFYQLRKHFPKCSLCLLGHNWVTWSPITSCQRGWASKYMIYSASFEKRNNRENECPLGRQPTVFATKGYSYLLNEGHRNRWSKTD